MGWGPSGRVSQLIDGVRAKARPHVYRIRVDCFHPVRASDRVLRCPTPRMPLRGSY